MGSELGVGVGGIGDGQADEVFSAELVGVLGVLVGVVGAVTKLPEPGVGVIGGGVEEVDGEGGAAGVGVLGEVGGGGQGLDVDALVDGDGVGAVDIGGGKGDVVPAGLVKGVVGVGQGADAAVAEGPGLGGGVVF